MSNTLEPNFNGLPKPTDWKKVIVPLQQANEKEFRGATLLELGDNLNIEMSINAQRVPAVPPGALVAGPADREVFMEIKEPGSWTWGTNPPLTNAQGNIATFYWNKTDWKKNDSAALPKIVLKNVIDESVDTGATPNAVLKYAVSKELVSDVIKFPDLIPITWLDGYYHPQTKGTIYSANYLSTQIFQITEGEVFNLEGYMKRNTINSSAIEIVLMNTGNTTFLRVDLKNTDKYRFIAPAGYDIASVVVAYNFDRNQNLEPYRDSFKMFKGDLTKSEIILPETNVNNQDYYLYDTNSRNLSRKNEKLNSAVKSLRNLKSAEAGEIEIVIENRLGVDITDAIAIVHLHHGARTGYSKLTNDYFMNGVCKTDFSDIRFLDADGSMFDIKKQSHGNYEIIADSRLRYQMYPSADGTVFGSPSVGGVFSTENNFVSQTQISPDGIISGANHIGDVFYYKNNNLYKRKKSEAYSTERMVLQGNPDITGEILWQVGAFVLDDQNNIYVAPYQGLWDGRIYKSTDAGETFTLVHQNQKQHCHSMCVDKSVTPNVIYANFDGDARIIGQDISAGTFKSEDRGLTWIELEFPFAPDFGVMHSGHGIQIGGGEAALKLIPTNYRRENEGKWEVVMDEQANVFRVIELNGNIYFAVTTADQYKYAKIFRSTDNGKTYDVILDTGYRNVTSTAGGWRYGSPIVATPTGDESQLLLHYASVISSNFPPVRIYDGGNHYQAMFYVRIPLLPAGGKTIKVGYGYLMEDVEGEVFQDTRTFNDVYRLPLNEFGKRISDSLGNTFNIGDSEWDWRKSTVRFGKVYPPELPYRNNTAVVLKNILEVDNARMKRSKDFSFSFWVRTKRYDLSSAQELPIIRNDYMSFFFNFDSRLTVRFGSNTAFVKGVLKNLQLQEYMNITVTISNQTIPVMLVYANTWLVDNQTAPLTGFAPPSDLGKWKLGGSDFFYMSDFRFFDKELSHNEVIQLFEGGRIANS